MSKPDIATSIEQANLHHPTIKLTAEISATETVFLDTIVYKGTRCKDQKTHVKIHLRDRGYPHNLVEKLLSEVKLPPRVTNITCITHVTFKLINNTLLVDNRRLDVARSQRLFDLVADKVGWTPTSAVIV